MPFIEIAELAAEAVSGDLYLLVHFWPDAASHTLRPNNPDLTNDFVMQIPTQGDRVVTNAQGWGKRASDGVFVDPTTLSPADPPVVFEREVVVLTNAQIIARIRRNIADYYVEAVARGWSGDHTGDASKPFFANGRLVSQRPGAQRLARIAIDRQGLVSRTQIAALRGSRGVL